MENGPLKMQLFLLNMGMFNCHVSLLEGSHFRRIKQYISMTTLSDLSLRLPGLGLYYNTGDFVSRHVQSKKTLVWVVWGLDSDSQRLHCLLWKPILTNEWKGYGLFCFWHAHVTCNIDRYNLAHVFFWEVAIFVQLFYKWCFLRQDSRV